nr:hypothetical protein [Vibrio splendidus]MCC4880854.1 hypothetical protein [Vibrio splendidus]
MKITLAGYEKNHDKGNCRLYAHEAGNRDNNFVIIDNGDGMTKWGLPRFEVCTCAKPFSEPCTPISGNWELVTEKGADIGSFFHGLSKDIHIKPDEIKLNNEGKGEPKVASPGLSI